MKPNVFQYQSKVQTHSTVIEIKNNKARHNLSNVKYRQMAFRLVDGAVLGVFWNSLVKQKLCTATRGRLHEDCFDLSQYVHCLTHTKKYNYCKNGKSF